MTNSLFLFMFSILFTVHLKLFSIICNIINAALNISVFYFICYISESIWSLRYILRMMSGNSLYYSQAIKELHFLIPYEKYNRAICITLLKSKYHYFTNVNFLFQ